MRENTINRLKAQLDDGHLVAISKKSIVDYLFGTQLFDGIVLISNSEVCIFSRYAYPVTRSDIVSYCIKDVTKACVNYIKNSGYRIIHTSVANMPFKLITRVSEIIKVVDDFDERMIIKEPFDEDCIRVNAILLSKVFTEWKRSAHRADSIDRLIKKFKSLAYYYGAEDVFASFASVSIASNPPSRFRIPNNDLYLFDFGIKYQGLFSDITTTVKFSPYTETEIDVLNKLHKLQSELADEVQPGYTVDMVVRKSLEKIILNPDEKFSRGFGHSVGVDIHEDFSIAIDGSDVFSNNMIFTIEPQIQVNNYLNDSMLNESVMVYRIESTYTFFNGMVQNYFSTIPIINYINS